MQSVHPRQSLCDLPCRVEGECWPCFDATRHRSICALTDRFPTLNSDNSEFLGLTSGSLCDTQRERILVVTQRLPSVRNRELPDKPPRSYREGARLRPPVRELRGIDDGMCGPSALLVLCLTGCSNGGPTNPALGDYLQSTWGIAISGFTGDVDVAADGTQTYNGTGKSSSMAWAQMISRPPPSSHRWRRAATPPCLSPTSTAATSATSYTIRSTTTSPSAA